MVRGPGNWTFVQDAHGMAAKATRGPPCLHLPGDMSDPTTRTRVTAPDGGGTGCCGERRGRGSVHLDPVGVRDRGHHGELDGRQHDSVGEGYRGCSGGSCGSDRYPDGLFRLLALANLVNLLGCGEGCGDPLGGIQGLLHVSEMGWSRVSANEVTAPGDQITVKVLRVDEANGRISLGLKQLSADPWTTVQTTYAVGQRLSLIHI